MLPTLTTERLTLRPLREDDAESLHAAFADTELMRWWSSGPHESVGETRDYALQNATSEHWPTWAITLADDVAIGWIVFGMRREGVAEIGYILRRDHWGQGIAREAVGRVLDYGFETLGLRRVFADTDPDNAGSNALLRALGFTQEGRLRAEWKTHIGVRDSLIWGLLADEWLNRTEAKATR